MARNALLVLIMLVAATVAAYWLNPAWFETSYSSITQQLRGSSTLYRWTAADGSVQVSDHPPADGIDYEVVEYQHQTNVMPMSAGDDDGY